MKFAATIRFCLVFLTPIIPVTGVAETEGKKLFSGKHPHMVAFRGEGIVPTHRNYRTWSADLQGCSAVIRKFWDEEIDYKPQTVEWAQRYMKEHPETTFLWHLNSESRVAHDKPEVLRRYFPGHWALLAGVSVKQKVAAEQTKFFVSKPGIFNEVGFVDAKSNVNAPQDLVIVGRNADGSLDWSKCEYATISTVDRENKSIIVQRGRYGYNPLDYGEKGIYIAPIIGSVWAGNRLWFYNHSTTCPRNAAGKNASDLFLEEILAKIASETGELRDFDGIAFDIMYWIARVKGMDLNNDGIADGDGIVDGKHVWRDGMFDWLSRLREAVGQDYILTSDSGLAKHQRAVGMLNGMEAEGFPYHRDAFRSFSTPLNHFAYWQKFGMRKNALNYAVIKYQEKKDISKADQYARFATATATCLDVFASRYTVREGSGIHPIDELIAGTRNEAQWLGKFAGPLIRGEDSSPDLFEGGGTALTKKFLAEVSVSNGRYTLENSSILRLHGEVGNALSPIKLTIKDIQRPTGDIVVCFDVKSGSPLSLEFAGTPVPRMITAGIDGLPDYPEGARRNEFLNDFGGAFGTSGFITQRFYFRDLDEGEGDSITLHLTFEGQGTVDLKSLKLLAGSQTMAREFENGVVLVNPSFDTKSFDLRAIFPDYKGGYRYIKGRQAPNSGKPVGDPNAMEVESIDALMVEKISP